MIIWLPSVNKACVRAFILSVRCLVGLYGTTWGLESRIQFWHLSQEWGLRVLQRRKSHENFDSSFFGVLVTIWYQSAAVIRPFWHYNQPLWNLFGQNPSFRSTLDGAPWSPWCEICKMNASCKHYGCLWTIRSIGHWRSGRVILFPLHFSNSFVTKFPWQVENCRDGLVPELFCKVRHFHYSKLYLN